MEPKARLDHSNHKFCSPWYQGALRSFISKGTIWQAQRGRVRVEPFSGTGTCDVQKDGTYCLMPRTWMVFREYGFITHIQEIESLPSSMMMGRMGYCEGLKNIYGAVMDLKM